MIAAAAAAAAITHTHTHTYRERERERERDGAVDAVGYRSRNRNHDCRHCCCGRHCVRAHIHRCEQPRHTARNRVRHHSSAHYHHHHHLLIHTTVIM